MRTKRFLLVTAALSTVACGKDPAMKPDTKQPDAETLPLPANPKGSFYDAGTPSPVDTPPPPPAEDAATKNPPPPPIKDAGGGPLKPHPLPANPKGSFYDGGKRPPPKPDVF